VSPELVLVDAALSEEVRRRLVIPDDTLTRLGGRGDHPPDIVVAADQDELELVGPPAASEVSDLRITGDESSSYSETLDTTPHDFAQNEGASRMYPVLPAPAPGRSLREGASDAALRRIGELFDDEPEPSKKRSRRALSTVSVAAASCSVAVFAVDLRLGLADLPGWLHL
jgi:hypothetical protein